MFSTLKIIVISLALLLSNVAFAKALSDYSASITELTIVSHGQRMSGLAYLAAGEGPHPTVLLLHGYPGNEKNLDVAQALRSKGWNVVFFHYRGAWGSEGEFSFRNAEQDVQAVLNYLNDEKNALQLRIERKQISVVGHSMGGHMAIAGILDNPLVKCAVAYDGANLGVKNSGFINDPKTAELWKEYSDSLFMLKGWSGAKAQAETKKYGVELNLINRVNKITGRPVLFVPANTRVIPMELHITPLVSALKATKNSQIFYKVIEDDHSFSSSRAELVDTTFSFLNSYCKDKSVLR